MAGYQVITAALRAEAPKWDEFAVEAASIRGAVESADLGLLAFFVGDPVTLGIALDAGVHKRAYDGFQSYMESVLRGAETEFGQIGDALIKIADAYDKAEEVCELNLNEIYSV